MSGLNDLNWLEQVNWNADGLVPVITQDHASGKALMLAWMNREALELTCTERCAVYWSRSKQRLWRKGEQSGHEQQVREVRLDCDRDALLLRVDQQGGIACHTGRESCFYLRKTETGWEAADPVLKDPKEIYHK